MVWFIISFSPYSCRATPAHVDEGGSWYPHEWYWCCHWGKPLKYSFYILQVVSIGVCIKWYMCNALVTPFCYYCKQSAFKITNWEFPRIDCFFCAPSFGLALHVLWITRCPDSSKSILLITSSIVKWIFLLVCTCICEWPMFLYMPPIMIIHKYYTCLPADL